MQSPAHQLLDGFTSFRKLHWNHSPIEGLKPSEVWVLMTIKKASRPGRAAVKVSDIGKSLHVAMPSVTQLVKSLEAGGYVVRERDEKDRRVVRVILTAKGETAMRKAKARFRRIFEDLAEYLGDKDSVKLAELLIKVSSFFDTWNQREFTN